MHTDKKTVSDSHITSSPSPENLGNPLTYRAAGVDIIAGDKLVEAIKPLAKKTEREGVLASIGGFGALFEISKKYQNPVLVSSTDGVGTKLKLAFELNNHQTIGIDLVAMSVNDILVQGAEPLFFLDYFSCGKLDIQVAQQVIAGIANGCQQANCALIGGETAEMPGMYPQGEYDLAGFAVGVVEKDQIIDGRNIVPGDCVLGLASSGIHSNGYSLVRKIIETKSIDLHTPLGDRLLHEALMEPTKIYVHAITQLKKEVVIKGLAHITGGGLTGNIPRILPAGAAVKLQRAHWNMPPIFDWLQKQAQLDAVEMHQTFNCGIGMIVIVDPADVQTAKQSLNKNGEQIFELGQVIAASATAQTEADLVVIE